MTVDKRTGDIVVARDDAIYYYTPDGRGPPRAYEAPKRTISVFRDYVAVVSPPPEFTHSSAEAGQRRFGGSAADAIFSASTFSLLETELRVIGHTETLVTPVHSVFPIWGDLYTLSQDGKVSDAYFVEDRAAAC